jgi:hypothetical protein
VGPVSVGALSNIAGSQLCLDTNVIIYADMA